MTKIDDSRGGPGRADELNRECLSPTLDRRVLAGELARLPQGGGALFGEGSSFFADSPVFVDEECLGRQAEIVAAIEKVVAMPAYQARALAHAPDSARFAPRAQGVFVSYDFHLAEGGPRLIEINTNAGGGLLNVLLGRAQRGGGEGLLASSAWLGVADAERAFLSMFLEEWQAERGDAPLRTVAIVDEAPEGQFLYPEFLLFQRLFERHGVAAVVCDPGDLAWDGEALRRGGLRIDLAYNRLTDFGLEEAGNAALREAYLKSGVVLTPHPRAHALYADKRNLALLTDAAALREMGVDAATQAVLLGGIARTFLVRREDAEALWGGRKRLFFKPVAGYGGRGAYRGDKLTRRVFEDILQGGYVAQEWVPPGERLLRVGGELAPLKFDLRHYAYRGRIQLTAARLYQGQTTNFRTPGGGFAPVVVVP